MAQAIQEIIIGTAEITNGSIVNADISDSAAISQSKISSAGVPWVTGNYYTNPEFISALTTFAVQSGRLYAHRFDMKARPTKTFLEIVNRVTTAIDGAKIRLGIYNDANGVPGSLVLDAGEFTCSGVSAQNAAKTISQSLTIGSNYWLAFISDSAVTVLANSTTSVLPENGSSAPGDTRDYTGVFAAQAYGALPSSFPAVTWSNNTIPVIKLLA